MFTSPGALFQGFLVLLASFGDAASRVFARCVLYDFLAIALHLNPKGLFGLILGFPTKQQKV